MRTVLATTAILTAAAATAACHPAAIGHGANRSDRSVSVADRLDCPSSQGNLERVEEAADGRRCRYTGPDGEEVVLSYLALDGKTPQAALAPIEADFRTAVPDAVASDAPSTTDADGAHASWSDTASSTTKHDSATVTKTTTVTHDDDDDDNDGDKRPSRHGRDDHVHLMLPGMSIDADNGHAKIRAFGQTIDADDSKGGRAVVHSEWNGMQSNINAHDHGAEMRFGWIGQHAVDMTYIVAGKTPGPTGKRAAAYVAKGPTSGPLVIAIGKSADGTDSEDGDRDDARGAVHDLKRLVERNVHRS